MDDLELDRELQTALDVTPSPEFVARVRGAIAARPRIRVTPRWLLPAGAAACVLLAAVLSGVRVRDAVVEAPVEVPRPTSRPLPASVDGPDRGQSSSRPSVAQALKRHPPVINATASATSELPEVLVSQADKRAFEEFVTAVWEQRVTPPLEGIEAPTTWATNALTVAPLTIEPLEVTFPRGSSQFNN